MSELVKIAFRNLFRNLKRSLLTIFISMLAVACLVFGNSFLGGMFDNILSESIKFSGHIRLASLDYDIKERLMSLTGNVPEYEALKASLLNHPQIRQKVETITGRLKFGAVIFKGEDISKEGLGYGIEAPDVTVLDFKNITYQGRIIDFKAKDEIMIGRQLADSLSLNLGDEVTILARTVYNSPYALNFRVVGFFDMQNSQLNKTFYISLSKAQYLLDMEGRVSEVLIFGKTIDNTDKIMKDLKSLKETKDYQLKTWGELGMGPVFRVIVMIVSLVIRGIFLVLAGLGIANTMLMAIMERRSEIGLLKSMGMREEEIVALFTFEGVFLGLLGTILGLVVGGSCAHYIATEGIKIGSSLEGIPFTIRNVIYGQFNVTIFITAGLLGLGAAFLSSLLPSKNGAKLNPTEALRKE
ncbi:MAG TPA: FtsX-like permease family protein [Bacillota bacterium]|nr:FtsX-like permease family protein [Bacillota bacterium]